MAQAYNVDTNTFEDSSSFSKNKIKQQDYKVYLYKPLKLGPLNIIQFLACHFGVLLFLFVLFKLSLLQEICQELFLYLLVLFVLEQE